jgi:hypothetical protein
MFGEDNDISTRRISVNENTRVMMDKFLNKDNDGDDDSTVIDINNSEFRDILKPLDFNGDGKLSKSEILGAAVLLKSKREEVKDLTEKVGNVEASNKSLGRGLFRSRIVNVTLSVLTIALVVAVGFVTTSKVNSDVGHKIDESKDTYIDPETGSLMVKPVPYDDGDDEDDHIKAQEVTTKAHGQMFSADVILPDVGINSNRTTTNMCVSAETAADMFSSTAGGTKTSFLARDQKSPGSLEVYNLDDAAGMGGDVTWNDDTIQFGNKFKLVPNPACASAVSAANGRRLSSPPSEEALYESHRELRDLVTSNLMNNNGVPSNSDRKLFGDSTLAYMIESMLESTGVEHTTYNPGTQMETPCNACQIGSQFYQIPSFITAEDAILAWFEQDQDDTDRFYTILQFLGVHIGRDGQDNFGNTCDCFSIDSEAQLRWLWLSCADQWMMYTIINTIQPQGWTPICGANPNRERKLLPEGRALFGLSPL